MMSKRKSPLFFTCSFVFNDEVIFSMVLIPILKPHALYKMVIVSFLLRRQQKLKFRSYIYSLGGAFRNSIAIMGKSGNVNCFELEGPKFLESYLECLEWFFKDEWDTFCFKFQGSNYEVAREFETKINVQIAQVGDLTLHVTKKIMATTTTLVTDGERQFKNKRIMGEDITHFLKAENQNVEVC